MLNEKIVKELENIESQLNEDTPNISDIRVDVALLIKELDEPHYVSGCGGQKNVTNLEDIQIDGC
jgi:uncharacterized protein (DUF169 family)